MPLDGFAGSGVLDLSSIADAQLSGGRIDGKIYAISLGTNSLAMVFDPELFEKAGEEIPDTIYTWDEWVALCKRIHDKLGIFGAGGNFQNEHIFKTWLKEHGVWLYNEDQTALGYKDDQLYVEFFEMLLDLQQYGAMPTLEWEVARAGLGLEDALIVSQQSAMDFAWSNMIVALTGAAGRSLKMGLMPQLGKGTVYGNYLKPSMFFSITSQAKHPTEAAMFIDFITNSIEANQILMAERGVPIAPAVRNALLPNLNPAQQEMFRYIDIAEQHSSPIDPPDPPKHNNIMQNIYDQLAEQVLYGDISPEVAAEEFRFQAESILQGQ
jgi:multiple sugar transport system substrate-binding protein